jgi:PASTA domain
VTYNEPQIANGRPPARPGGPRPRPAGMRRVVLAAAVLAFLGAGVGTAFGLAGKTEQPGDPGASSVTTSPTAEASESPGETQPPTETQSAETRTSNPGGGGHQTTKVPHVVGHDEDTARNKVRERNLSAKVKYVCSGRETPGKVVAQNPQGDATAAVNSTVSLDVQGVSVPHVVGKDEPDAETELQNAGLTVNVSAKADASAKAGKVLSQNPSGGTCVKKGSPVTIVVAKEVAPSGQASVASP